MKEYSTFSKSPRLDGASPSDCLVSYPGPSLRESYLSAKMQSMYSTASADMALRKKEQAGHLGSFLLLVKRIRKIAYL